jgi:hypothetical protein
MHLIRTDVFCFSSFILVNINEMDDLPLRNHWQEQLKHTHTHAQTQRLVEWIWLLSVDETNEHKRDKLIHKPVRVLSPTVYILLFYQRSSKANRRLPSLLISSSIARCSNIRTWLIIRIFPSRIFFIFYWYEEADEIRTAIHKVDSSRWITYCTMNNGSISN